MDFWFNKSLGAGMNRCCMLIVLAVTGCAVPVEKPPAGPEDDVEVVSEWEPDEEGGCPDSWVLVYSLKGRIDITHTPLNIGNADAEAGPITPVYSTARAAGRHAAAPIGSSPAGG